jgi:hypothetical protein
VRKAALTLRVTPKRERRVFGRDERVARSAADEFDVILVFF